MEVKKLLKAAKKQFGRLFSGLNNLKWKDIATKVHDLVKRHPRCVAWTVQLLIILAMAYPHLITLPALSAAGFSSIGPVAGTAAAAHQSAFGATTLFSILQSAAMGGYGVVIVNTVVQVVAVVGIVIAEWFKRGSAKEKSHDV